MSFSAISFPCTPACPQTQYSPTACQVEVSFNTFWHCHTNGDTVVATGRAVRANTPTFLWSNFHLNFTSTGQDSVYLSLKTASYFPTEPSSHRLPIDSSPSPFLHPVPICKPDEPFNYRRIPGPLVHSSLVNNSNPIFGFKIKCWPHNIDSHIKYGIRLLKLHQYATMSSSGVKCASPELPTPVVGGKCFHSTSRSSAHCSHYP